MHSALLVEQSAAADAALDYSPDGGTLVFADAASRSLRELLERVAPSDIAVLIYGPPGTGKGTVARYLHFLSGRPGPLVSAHCGTGRIELASDEPSVEGVRILCPGGCDEWFEAAAGGTLLLDGVGELPPRLQTELLYALQERRSGYRRQVESTDVRIISTTAVGLADEAAAGRFRSDLLYRLNPVPVTLLPLSERSADIVPLTEHFIRFHARRMKMMPPTLTPDAIVTLSRHTWPGNLRELENVIRLALLLTAAGQLTSAHLRFQDALPTNAQAPLPLKDAPSTATLSALLSQMFQQPSANMLEQLEAQIVAEAFEFADRNQVRAAALLGISRNVLRTLLKKYRLHLFRERSGPDDSPE